MEYYEQLTFTGKGDVEEAEETAIKLIREFEELALRRCPDKGYIEEKVAKLIEENKDVIIDRAANMVAGSVSLKKALDMIAVELNMKEEATK